jgi:endonuclease/exonuclease/phosphatase family metal-dependent hydrolase
MNSGKADWFLLKQKRPPAAVGGAWLARVLFAFSILARLHAAETFRVATYNVENYVLESTGTRTAKSAESRAKIRESIRALKPDVIALQELGGEKALLELRSALQAEGLTLPHWELVHGWDTNIQVGVLSRFPFTAKRPHTKDGFLLNGRRFRVTRGFLEVDISVTPRYHFTLLTAHLKSRRVAVEADESELREQEALLLREKLDARLAREPEANIVVLGDFNDVRDSRAVKAILGRGRTALIDTRPAEPNGDNQPNPVPQFSPRNITWTHYYGKEDTYSRIDYLMLSRGMAREWSKPGTHILAVANWGVGSDHRPIVAEFVADDR